MSDMERARRAGGSGIPFTVIVVVAIVICIGLLVWRASSGDANNPPAAIGRNG